MARRKRQVLEDSSDSDDSERNAELADDNGDPDTRAERELFENPYGRKRRRTNGKDDAIYGVFGESDDDEDDDRTRRKRQDMSKAPIFTSSTKVNTSLDNDANDMEGADDEVDEAGDTDRVSDEDSDSSSAEPVPPRTFDEDEDEDERPRFGGIGSTSRSRVDQDDAPRQGLGTRPAPSFASHAGVDKTESNDEQPRSGLGASSFRAGLGSSAPEDDTPAFPSAFGKTANAQRKAFVRDSSDTASPGIGAAKLSASEKLHFSKLEGSFGAKLMAKMGWESGTALGTSGTGIVTPIESKLRPGKIGIAFKGFKEKTEQSKAEARRRGEVISDDEGAKPKRGRAGKTSEPVDRSAAWKSKPRKSKKGPVEHKSYEQILQEAGESAPQAQQQIIIDATGAGGPREIASLADMASWTPSTDTMRIPEVRHNLRMIVDMCKGELDGLAREARALEERKKWIDREDKRLRDKMKDEAQLIAKLQSIHLIVDGINIKSQDASSTLESFTPDFTRLTEEYSEQYSVYNLDHIVVGAVVPLVKSELISWNPLEDPTADGLTITLRQWIPALKMTIPEPPVMEVDVYGGRVETPVKPTTVDENMTAYDALLWGAWLPKVRSALNNEWSPSNASPAIRLYEAWAPLLPPFVRDNLLDQVILPKIQKAVSDWSTRSETSLQSLVFPWLPHVGLRVDELLGDATRKVKAAFRNWKAKDGVPVELMAWKDVVPPAEWDNLILKYVVPKLGATLREELRINPRAQDTAPLTAVLAWTDVLRPSIVDALLEQEFFPKWLDALHTWLVHPSANLAEIADWFDWWRRKQLNSIAGMEAVKSGLARGLQLMEAAMALGDDRSRLPKPARPGAKSTSADTTRRAPQRRPAAARVTEITFRALVEEHAAAHNLLVLPTQRVHEASRMPLLRVSKTVEGKGGLVVYILDDAVWTAPEAGADGPWRAITMDEMVVLASRK